jgi:hypothetical protein
MAIYPVNRIAKVRLYTNLNVMLSSSQGQIFW